MTPQFRNKLKWLTDKRNRAFVAAPLLGTIIFVACVIFIINLNKVESANVVLAESDSYHNRIVSLLEMYRSDTASMFRQQLTYVIEHYLTSGCWLNLFDVDNGKETARDSNPGYDDGKIVRFLSSPNQDYRIEELRYSKCKSVNRILSQVSQSVYSCKSKCTPVTTECRPPNCECTCGGDPQCVSMKDCSDKDQGCKDCEDSLYGLPKIMSDLSGNTTFEGIVFRASNPDEFKFFKDEAGGPEAEQFSSTLLAGSLFDCHAFAVNGSFSCCSLSSDFFDDNLPPIGTPGSLGYRGILDGYSTRYLDDWNTPCGARHGKVNGVEMNGQLVPGCEDGSFFMRISLNNSFVYQRMPRFMADDSVGNQLRTGALGENDFYLPISYPLYKYINYSFQLYEKLAYGVDKGTNEGINEGVAEGLCVQSVAAGSEGTNGKCDQLADYKGGGYPGDAWGGVGGVGGVPECTQQNTQACEENVQSAFIENRLKDSCEAFTSEHTSEHRRQAQIYLCLQEDGNQMGQSMCGENPNSWHYTCGGSGDNDLFNSVNPLFDSEQKRREQVASGYNSLSVWRSVCPENPDKPADSPQCAALGAKDKIELAVRFNDLTSEHQVDPENQNAFCSYIRIKHYAPATP